MEDEERTCPHCGDGFTPKRYNQRFCSPGCQGASKNKRLTEGYAAIALVKAWHEGRHAPGGSRDAEICSAARRELTQLASMLIERDRKAGRPRSLDYVADLMKDGGMVLDRVKP